MSVRVKRKKEETAVPEIDGHSCDEVDGRTGREERENERNKELKTIADRL